jgi:hypothetical protein
MLITDYLNEEINVNGVKRYSRGVITTQTSGPKITRAQLVEEYQAAIAMRDALDEVLFEMDMLLQMNEG